MSPPPPSGTDIGTLVPHVTTTCCSFCLRQLLRTLDRHVDNAALSNVYQSGCPIVVSSKALTTQTS